MNGLVTFVESFQERKLGSNPLKEVADAFFSGEERDEALLFLLIGYCEDFSIQTPQDLIKYYHNLLSLLFIRKFYKTRSQKLDNQIRLLILKGRLKGFGKEFCLQKGYEALATLLFEDKMTSFDFKQLEKGAILYNQLPHPLQNSQMGLLAFYLGLAGKDDELLSKGLKCAEFFLSCCDSQRNLFRGLWLKEEDYQEVVYQETFSLFFEVAEHLTSSSRPKEVAEIFSKKVYLDPFIRLFHYAFIPLVLQSKAFFPKLHQDLRPHNVDRSLGFLYYQYGETSLACSAAGFNTGISSIHKRGVQIISMGPHCEPLGEPGHYGIFRLSNGSQAGFKDLNIESGNKQGKFQGWVRLAATNREGRSKEWLFVNLEAEKEKIDLAIRRSGQDDQISLFYVFFISADRGQVGDRVELFPARLDYYQGMAKKVIFEKEKDTVEITPNFEGEMRMIPLAGKDYFWSADFLLAFSLKRKRSPYRWAIH